MSRSSTPIHPVQERFAEFGETEAVPLTKIQKLTGVYLARNWAAIPHVTHNDEADVTLLEKVRADLAAKYSDRRITSLAFHVKAVVAALRQFPVFNASLDDKAEFIVYKKFYNIGIAVDTPNGLLVPVIRRADTKTIPELAMEIEAASSKARAKGLSIQEMSGGCFSISSLGKDGGTSFTPIINAPEVAILGISRLQERPARDGQGISWHKCLPLSLSYDHRVINGAAAAAFTTFVKDILTRPLELIGTQAVR